MAIIVYCYLLKKCCFKKNEDNANLKIENNNPQNNPNIDSKNITLITNENQSNSKKKDNNVDNGSGKSNIEKSEKEDGNSIH